MFFGSKKIPELAKGLGRAMREVKDASNEIKKEIRDSATSVKDDLDLKK
jgi:sec-independent protein translocase protein TatA